MLPFKERLQISNPTAMVVLTTTKVGRSYRVTLPQEVRELLELREGDEIVFFTVRGQRGRVCFRKSS
jgi:AbrB family looped-hinge helix DNA binding protein